MNKFNRPRLLRVFFISCVGVMAAAAVLGACGSGEGGVAEPLGTAQQAECTAQDNLTFSVDCSASTIDADAGGYGLHSCGWAVTEVDSIDLESGFYAKWGGSTTTSATVCNLMAMETDVWEEESGVWTYVETKYSNGSWGTSCSYPEVLIPAADLSNGTGTNYRFLSYAASCMGEDGACMHNSNCCSSNCVSGSCSGRGTAPVDVDVQVNCF